MGNQRQTNAYRSKEKKECRSSKHKGRKGRDVRDRGGKLGVLCNNCHASKYVR